MPHCTVRYSVRLKPKVADVPVMDAVAVYYEERALDELGEPGNLIWRRLTTFVGPTGYDIKEAVTRKREWEMDVRDRIGPLVWDALPVLHRPAKDLRKRIRPALRTG